jgi:peptide/nickel transport system permease protein
MLARLTFARTAARPRRLRQAEPWATLVIVTCLALLVVALFGERLAPHEPIAFTIEHRSDPRPYDPGVVYPFGSDVLGRDLLSLVLAGARTTLTIVLVGGLARVLAGALVAVVGTVWSPLRLLTESVAELVSAIPATIVALVIVKVLVRADTNVAIFVGSLLVFGWAGPYRVVRAELDRLAAAPFTQGARAIGVGRLRMVWRHHLPHVVPVLAVNLSQQVVASLVLIAELGVLGTFVGTSRTINIEESLSRVITGPVNVARIADPPEWGGLLASARTIESLWTTRWLILVPGLAFGATALAVGMLGVALGRRYARRELIEDLRGSGTAFLAAATLALIVLAAALPPRYGDALGWARDARRQMGDTADISATFGAAGLQPLGSNFAVTREVVRVTRAGPARASIASATVSERESEPQLDIPDVGRNVRAFISGDTGGGIVDAPLVFAGRGISFDDYQPTAPPVSVLQRLQPDFARLIRQYQYADDWAGVDVRGKIVLLVRFYGLRSLNYSPSTGFFQKMNDYAIGPYVGTSISNAIKRGASGVIFVDPSLPLYNDVPANATYALGERSGGMTPYTREGAENPPSRVDGVPVVVVSEPAAKTLLQPLGIDISSYTHYDDRGDPRYQTSPSRDLALSARLEVPLQREVASTTSYVARVAAAPDAAPVVIWAPRRVGAPHPSSDVLATLARTLANRGVPVLLVDFDPAVDPDGGASQIRELLAGHRPRLVIVIDRLDGNALTFQTANGDLIPAFDAYAQTLEIPHRLTTTTARIGEMSGIAPFTDLRTMVIRGSGEDGDRRADAAALLAYIAGRVALGAEELR